MDRPPFSPLLAGLRTAGAIAAVSAGAALLSQYAGFAMQAELVDKVLARPSPVLPEVRAREAAELGGYRYIDRKAGVVGIPVDHAQALVLRERGAP